MRMRGKKAIYNYSDTFSLESTLAPIIKAGLEKFRDVLVQRNSQGDILGIPCGVENTHQILLEDGSEEAFQEWISTLDKMIVGFSDEIDIAEYDFSYDMTNEKVEEDGSVSYTLSCTNEDEATRYREDCKLHHQQRLEGRELFAKHFEDLWW